MAESTELTTRDVFSQIDRRLTRIEDDLREFRQYVEERFQRIEERFEERFAGLESRVDSSINRLDDKIDRNFRWLLGIMLASWLSTMSAILLK